MTNPELEVHEVDVVIAPDGTTRVEVRGLAGAGCLDLTAELEQVLGGEIVARELTPEAQQVLEQRTQDELRRGTGS